MAIIQISKLQQRSGNLVDLPQLDEAELGWATDAKRLFIGKTTPNENVEILTSYSEISFSQLTGSVGNLNINPVTLADGQVLSYDGTNWVNKGRGAGGLLTLGDVGNLKIDGGAIGYVLETDGLGNLAWAPKGFLYTEILDLTPDSNNDLGYGSNAVVMTVPNTTPYVNLLEITISGADDNANSNVNARTFYVQLTDDYPTSGNVVLLTDPNISNAFIDGNIEYTNDPNSLAVATSAALGSGGSAGGSAFPPIGGVQYNDGGLLRAKVEFTFNDSTNSLNVGGNVSANNFNASNLVTASRFISNVATGTSPLEVSSTTVVANLNAENATTAGTVTTNAQPNITSVGNLTSLIVDANLSANSAFIDSDLEVGSLLVQTDANVVGNLFVTEDANITANLTANNAVFGNDAEVQGELLAQGNANVSGNLNLLGIIDVGGDANFSGNISTLGDFSVTGSANITSDLIVQSDATISGNISADIVTANTGAFTDVSGNGRALTSLSASNIDTGTLSQDRLANSSITINGVTIALGGSETISTATSESLTPGDYILGDVFNGAVARTWDIDATSSSTGNKIVVRDTSGSFSANVITANAITGTLTTASQPNITSVGTLSSLSVAGGITGTLVTTSQPNITSVGTLSSLSVAGNVSAGNISTGGALSVTGNASVGNVSATNGVFTSVSGNGSSLTSLNASQLTTGTVSNARLSGSYAITVSNANQLTTARSINGTSFNGTTDITTARWGTARNISIGTSTKSVDGSTDVSWTLSEIGAISSVSLGVSTSGSSVTVTNNRGSDATISGATTSAAGLVTTSNQTWAGIKTSNDFVATSDERLKDNIVDLDDNDCLEKVLALRPTSYVWKENNQFDTGLIAQDVEKVLSHRVHKTEDETLAVSYSKLVTELIGAVKAQQKTIEILSERIEKLEKFK